MVLFLVLMAVIAGSSVSEELALAVVITIPTAGTQEELLFVEEPAIGVLAVGHLSLPVTLPEGFLAVEALSMTVALAEAGGRAWDEDSWSSGLTVGRGNLGWAALAGLLGLRLGLRVVSTRLLRCG